jgi:hypothetical protein
MLAFLSTKPMSSKLANICSNLVLPDLLAFKDEATLLALVLLRGWGAAIGAETAVVGQAQRQPALVPQ